MFTSSVTGFFPLPSLRSCVSAGPMHYLSLSVPSSLARCRTTRMCVEGIFLLSLRIYYSVSFLPSRRESLRFSPTFSLTSRSPSLIVSSRSSLGIQMTSDDEYGRLSRAIGNCRHFCPYLRPRCVWLSPPCVHARTRNVRVCIRRLLPWRVVHPHVWYVS